MKYVFNPLLPLKIQQLPNNLTDIDTRSHTILSDIGTNTHIQIDTHLVATNPHSDSLAISSTAYTKTTAGQTINVTTAAELTAALAALAASPSLLGNVIIQLAPGTYTGNFIVPTLLYTGYTLTIQGSLTEVLSDTATGGAVSVFGVGGTKGYAEKTTAAWTVNAYRHKLLMNPSGEYTAIASNTATRILYPKVYFTQFSNTETIKVYDWAVMVTNSAGCIFTILSGANVVFKNIKITNSGAYGSKTSWVMRTIGYSDVQMENCYLSGSDAFGTIHNNGYSTLRLCDSVILGDGRVIRNETAYITATSITSTFHGFIIYLNGSNGSKQGLYNTIGSSVYMLGGILLDGASVAASIGCWTNLNSILFSWTVFIENWGTGYQATLIGFIYDDVNANTFAGNTTDKNPAAAADPGYIS